MPYRDMFEDLLKDEFEDGIRNPNNEVTKEEVKVTNADGSSTTTIVEDKENTPSARAKKQGFSDAAVDKMAANKTASANATGSGKPVGFAEASRGYSNADMDKYKNDTKLFDAGLLKEVPVDPSKVVAEPPAERELAYGATSPRGEAFAKLKAEKKLSEFDDVLTMGVKSGSISPEDAAKAKVGAQSEFDAASGLDTKPVVDDKIATGGTPFDTPAPFEGLSATEIMGAETDAKKLITEDPTTKKALDNIVTEIDEGKDPDTIFGEIKSFFKDNPVMGQAILSAVAGYISTGSLWKGAAAGIQGFAGGMQTEAATEVATAAATAKAKLERTTTIASYVKDGYTQQSAQDFIDSNGGTELKFSNRKLMDEFAKIQYRAQVKGETAGQKAGVDAIKDYYSWTEKRASNLGKHWTDEEREQYGIPDATTTVQNSALKWMDTYGLTYEDMNNPLVQVQFAEGLDDWNEHNRRAVANGNRNDVVQDPDTFIEARVNRHYASQIGLDIGILQDANGRVDSESLAGARKTAKNIAYGDETQDGVTEAQIFTKWQEVYKAYVEGKEGPEFLNQAKNAGKNPFLYWIETKT